MPACAPELEGDVQNQCRCHPGIAHDKACRLGEVPGVERDQQQTRQHDHDPKDIEIDFLIALNVQHASVKRRSARQEKQHASADRCVSP